MRDYLKKNSGNGRRGGDLFATLLFVVASFAFAAGTFALTDALMGSKDTTMSFVPMSATTYVHSNGHASTEALMSATAQLPSGIHPYEFALFTAPGDDAPQHGIVLAWSALKKPDASELQTLKERGATQLDARHYFFGDASLATAAKVAAAARASLSNDSARRDALDAMRSLFSVQVMTSPRQSVAGVNVPLLNDMLKEISPEVAVIGAAIRDKSFIARVTPISSLAADGTSRDSSAALDTARIGADLVVAQSVPELNLAAMLPFASADDAGVSKDTLAEGDSAFRTSLNSPFVLWVRKSPDAGQLPRFLLHFPKVPATVASSAVVRDFAIRNPSTDSLTLPDGDTTSELRVDMALLSGAGTSSDLTVGNGSGKVVVGSDGANGSLIGSDASFLNEFRSAGTGQISPKDPCGPSSNKLVVNDIGDLRATFPPFGFLVDKTAIDAISLNRTVGNELFFCGYRK